MKTAPLLLGALCFGAALTAFSGPVPYGKPEHYPDWWFERDIIRRLPEFSALTPTSTPALTWPDHYPVADDYAVANIGQLKKMASEAAAAIDAWLPVGVGENISDLAASWSPSPLVPGLRGDYFSNPHLSGTPLLSRFEALSFDWQGGAPAPGIPTDQFSSRWIGYVIPRESGTYRFQTYTDDGARLWLGSERIIDDWSEHAPRAVTSAAVFLEAGKLYALRMDYFERFGGAVAELRWQPPGSAAFSPVPREVLFSRSDVSYEDLLVQHGQAHTDDVQGLRGDYFSNPHLSGTPLLSRFEALSFDWQGGAPAPAMPTDEFSSRWIGFVIPQASGTYRFQTYTDDGARLWLGSERLIDDWSEHAPRAVTSAPVSLEAGKLYALRMDYFERFGGAVAELRWQPPGSAAFSPVPREVLLSRPAVSYEDLLVQHGQASADDFAALNLGQLKFVAAKFYERLEDVDYQGQPLEPGKRLPWSGVGADDYALVNLGQLKHVFSFILVHLHARNIGGQSGLYWRSSNGTLFSWGTNPRGLLGRGAVGAVVPAPGAIPLPKPVAGSAGGRAHGVAVLSDGQVYSWGDNEFGQLGDGTRISRAVPQVVPGLTGVVQVAAGDSHSVALKSDGTVWAWGANHRGQLGAGSSSSAPRVGPAQVAGLPRIVLLAAGARHTLALDAAGKVWAWGADDFGQLGRGDTVGTPPPEASPREVVGLDGAVSIAAGRHHSAAIISGGVPVLWGGGYAGQLGQGARAGSRAPISLAGLTAIRFLSLGTAHSLALGEDGAAHAWGAGRRGQLAPGAGSALADRAQPAPVPGLTNATVLSAGAHHGSAQTADGKVVVWGDNAGGRLGLPGAPAVVAEPTVVALP